MDKGVVGHARDAVLLQVEDAEHSQVSQRRCRDTGQQVAVQIQVEQGREPQEGIVLNLSDVVTIQMSGQGKKTGIKMRE